MSMDSAIVESGDVSMSKQAKTITQMDRFISSHLQKEQLTSVLDDFHKELDSLIRSHQDQNRKIREHTFLKIYPAVSLYHALQHNGLSQQQAWDIVAGYFYGTARDYADSMKKMMIIKIIYLMFIIF